MFKQPLYLLGMLPAVAAAAALYWFAASRRRRLTRLLGDAATVERLLPREAAGRRALQAALRLSSMALLFAALAGPQWGVELVATQTLSRDVVIAVDVSSSMLAADVKPDRLTRAKEELALLIDELKGSRIGIVAFAGEAAVVCPLTADAAAAKQLLRSLEPGFVPVPGTAIGKAIRRATALLSRYSGPKAIILLSDGEDHKTDPIGAAAEAAAEDIRVFTIGIGTPEGEPVPVKDETGAVSGYKKDKSGVTVVSRLGERALTEIAKRSGGEYYRATPGAAEATDIARRIEGAGDASPGGGTTRRYKNRFALPLALALALLLLEAFLPERAARGVLVSAILFACAPGSAATFEGSLRRGNKHYRRQEYLPALEDYQRAAGKRPRDRRPIFNAGDALYKLEQYDKAAEAFAAAARARSSPQQRAEAYYNLGNTRFQKGEYKEAVEAFRQAVTLNPKDEDARRNLAVALRRLKNPPPKTPNKDKPGDSKQPPPQPQPQDPKDGSPPPRQQPKPRPQDQLSKEDAERILRAVGEKEKAPRRAEQKAPGRRPDPEEDW